MSIIDIKRMARRIVHVTMKIPANRFRDGDAEATPDAIFVRRHKDHKPAGDLQGTSLSYAQTQEVQPRLIFLASDAPARLDVVRLIDGEAFSVDSLQNTDDEFVTAEVRRLPDAEALTFTLPEE